MEEIYDVECGAQRGVVVVNGLHHVAGDHQDNEQALDVVEQGDAGSSLRLGHHGALGHTNSFQRVKLNNPSAVGGVLGMP